MPDRDFPGYVELVQKQAPGEGRPMFAANHVTRNRRGLFGHLCHVCGSPTKSWDRWLFPLHSGGWVPMGDGEERYGGNVPPVHKACADRAAQLCLRTSAGATPFRCASAEEEGRMIQRTGCSRS